MNISRYAVCLLLAGLPWSPTSRADDAVVGTGSAASCTEAALNAAIAQLVPGNTFPGGVITFNCGPSPVTITLTAQKVLQAGSTLDGGDKVTLDGGNATRLIFARGLQSQITLRRIVLSNGRVGNDFGGAIYVENGAGLILDNAIVRFSRANFSGGAIFGEAGTTISLLSSTLIANQANYGGGIATNGALNLTDGLIANNTALLDEGGGVQIYDAVTTVNGTRFENNGAVNGGGFLQRGGTSTFTNGSFSDNTATQRGGGIAIYGNATLQLTGTTFLRNLADQGGAVSVSGVDQGSGSTRVRANKLIASNVRFEANTAIEGGGLHVFGVEPLRSGLVGDAVLTGCTFVSNTATRGGGLYTQGYFTATGLVVTDNTATRGAGAYFAPNYLQTIFGGDTSGESSLVGSRFERNIASGAGGGAFMTLAAPDFARSQFTENRAADGGGMALVENSLSVINAVSFVRNVATQRGGAIFINYALPGVIVANSTFNANQAQGAAGAGGDVFAFTDLTAYPTGQTQVSLFNDTMINGVAQNGSTVFSGDANDVRLRNSIVWPLIGGACFASGGTLSSTGGNVGISASCPFNQASDLTVSDYASLKLGALADNGGGILTQLPQADSPVLERLSCDPGTDSRGLPRPVDFNNDAIPLCDAGAVERQLSEGGGGGGDAVFANGFE